MGVLYAYVGWVDRCRRPQIYLTHDLEEAEQGVMKVKIETFARTVAGKRVARAKVRQQLLEKWGRAYPEKAH